MTPVTTASTSLKIVSADPFRRQGSIYNVGPAKAYLLIGNDATGAPTVSASNCSFPLAAGATYMIPSNFYGAIYAYIDGTGQLNPTVNRGTNEVQ